MAQIIKRGDKWLARVRKGKLDKSKTFNTKSAAELWSAKIISDIDLIRSGQSPDKTLRELADKYILDVMPKKRSQYVETKRLNTLLENPLFNIRLKNINSELFETWINERLNEVSGSTVCRELNILSNMFTTAVKKYKWMSFNPLRNIDRPKTNPPRTQRISDDDLDKLLYCSGYNQKEIKTKTALVGAALEFAIETAMRAGEICQLKRSNVDLKKRTAYLEMTKNGHPRLVPLTEKAIKIINQTKGKKVFDINVASLDALFRKIRNRAGLEHINFHDSRREALTRLSKKVDVMTLAKISGHRDLKVLLNTYYSPDMSEVALRL